MIVVFPMAEVSHSQESSNRPRIGLCLAGGGAHIGVLKVLEEMRVHIDYVAGTSIGSIVGGPVKIDMTIGKHLHSPRLSCLPCVLIMRNRVGGGG
jgi:NTE family protein